VVEDLGNHRYRLSTELFDGEGECVIDGEAVVLLDDLPDEAEGDDTEGDIEEGEGEEKEEAPSADATSR
jgi:hypothetical protein